MTLAHFGAFVLGLIVGVAYTLVLLAWFKRREEKRKPQLTVLFGGSRHDEDRAG